MPIIKVGAQSSLIEVERAIISLIVDRESQVRRRVEQIYERLLATLVDDAGIDGAGGGGRRRGAPPDDRAGRVLSGAGDGAGRRGDPADWARAVGATLAAGDPRALGARPAAPFWLASENDSPEALIVPLRLRGTRPATGAGRWQRRDGSGPAGRRAGGAGARASSWRSSGPSPRPNSGCRATSSTTCSPGSYPSEEAMLARARWMGHDLGRLARAAGRQPGGTRRPHVWITAAPGRRSRPDRGATTGAGRTAARAAGPAGGRAASRRAANL